MGGRLGAGDIPRISAISQTGTFLKGGPIHDNPAFAARTPPGEVIDSARWRVPSPSDFGEPLSNPNQLTFLSIDRSGTSVLLIPPSFAAPGVERSALSGFVQMYHAQNPVFLNSIPNPSAATAGFTGVRTR